MAADRVQPIVAVLRVQPIVAALRAQPIAAVLRRIPHGSPPGAAAGTHIVADGVHGAKVKEDLSQMRP